MRYSKMDLIDGNLVEVSAKTIDPSRCPHTIFIGDHYRDDGSCKCDDPVERAMMIKDWGYRKRDFRGVPLIKPS